MSYLDIARGVILGNERNERNEKSPLVIEADSRVLGHAPTSELLWVHVSRHEVEASVLPPGWDGTLPESCGWRSLCQSLGPCPRHLAGDHGVQSKREAV